jgi:hypothetical protein
MLGFPVVHVKVVSADNESADRVDPSGPFLFPRKDWSVHFR